MMATIGVFTRALGSWALRLFQLNLLWIVGSLCGGVLLGAGPATAAVMTVLRQDGLYGFEGERSTRDPLVREFADAWRREFWSANRLILALAAMVSVVVLALLALRLAPADEWAAASRGILTVLAVTVTAVAVLAWPMHSHFAESTSATLRRCLVFTLARPLWTIVHAVALASVLALGLWFPGVALVFGAALPCAVSQVALGLSGAVPLPRGARDSSLRALRARATVQGQI